MSICISLALEVREIFLSLQIGFSLETAAIVVAILESISELDLSLKVTDLRYVKLCTSYSFLGLYIILSLNPSGVIVIMFVLTGTISNAYHLQIGYNTIRFFLLFSIKDNVISEAKVKEDLTFSADNIFWSSTLSLIFSLGRC